MKFKILILLPFFFSNFLFSQTKETEKNNWAVKLNVIQLIDVFSFPTLQVSLERKVTEKISINAEYGFQLYDIQTGFDSISRKEKGFKANLEGRYYLYKNKKYNGVYVGLQAFYRDNQTISSIRYRKLDDVEFNSYTDVYDVRKKSYGINSIIGFQGNIGKKIVFEPFLGIGIKNRKIENDNIVFNSTIHESLENHKFIPSLEEQSGWDLNLCFGFRVGYKL